MGWGRVRQGVPGPEGGGGGAICAKLMRKGHTDKMWA